MPSKYNPDKRKQRYLARTEEQIAQQNASAKKKWSTDEDYRQKRLASTRAWRARNKEILKQKREIYLLRHRDELVAQRKSKRSQVNARLKQRRETDQGYRIAENLRNRLRRELKKCNTTKTVKHSNLLGCSSIFLKEYIENIFLVGMTWDNYGQWHIDHIKPCSAFNLTSLEEQKECFHYSNLQPLWAIDNLKKGSKLLIE